MATIENRSRTQITVKGRDDLTKFFPHTKNGAARAYREELIGAGLKPVVRLLDESYSVRFKVNGRRKNFTANREDEAIAIAKRVAVPRSVFRLHGSAQGCQFWMEINTHDTQGSEVPDRSIGAENGGAGGCTSVCR